MTVRNQAIFLRDIEPAPAQAALSPSGNGGSVPGAVGGAKRFATKPKYQGICNRSLKPAAVICGSP
jgi:hypothetical protein